MSDDKESTKSVAEITSHDVYPYAGPTDDRSLRHLYSGPNGERHQKVKVLQGGGDSGVMGYVGSPCDISNESSSSLDYIFRYIQLDLCHLHQLGGNGEGCSCSAIHGKPLFCLWLMITSNLPIAEKNWTY